MGDMKSIAECDGESGYPEFISDIHGYAAMEECEHVLSEQCPAVIRAAIPAGTWDDDDHPCDGDKPCARFRP